MRSFRDSAGRDWEINVTVDAVRRVKALVGVNLADVQQAAHLDRLHIDPIFLCDVLFALVRPQAERRGVSDEDFARALGGDVLRGALTALVEEIIDFFPAEATRKFLRAAADKCESILAAGMEAAAKAVEAIDFAQATSSVSSTSAPE